MNCRVIPIVHDVSVDCSRLISQDDLPKYPFFCLGKMGAKIRWDSRELCIPHDILGWVSVIRVSLST